MPINFSQIPSALGQWALHGRAWGIGLVWALLATGSPAQTTINRGVAEFPAATEDAARGSDPAQGPLRLMQPQPGPSDPWLTRTPPSPSNPPAPYVPSEFERYVQSQLPADTVVKRFGADLLTESGLASAALDPLPSPPADYIVRPGDEVAVTLWGGVDANLKLTVDRAGKIAVPRVGAIQVAGVRYAQLSEVIRQRVGQVFREFQISVTLGQLRSVRVFVSGYVQRPGSLNVSSLSSVLHVLIRAGGPSASGSFRDIKLRRGGREVAQFDLYELLVNGDRGADLIVQPDDVIHVGPVGPQVAMVGSVNYPAIFELKANDGFADVLRMAGGFNSVADRQRLAIERLADRAAGRVSELRLPADSRTPLAAGDLVRVFSAISVALPKDRQNKRVRVEGEVGTPGDYVLPPNSSLMDAIKVAGGLTPAAYVFGTEFSRESVRQTQQENYDRALRDMETELARNSASRRASTTEEVAAQSSGNTAASRLIERLRQVRPTGRVVLQLPPDAQVLPDLAVEDGDRIYIPTRSSSVGIFGSVYNTGSFVFQSGRRLDDYLRLAGGPTRGADVASAFVIRANGTVVSTRQSSSFWKIGDEFSQTIALPGDTIFVPEEMNKTTYTQDAKDWTQILYQFGLGLAGIKSLGL